MDPKGKLLAIGGNVDKGTDSESHYKQKSNLNFFGLQILKGFLGEMKGKSSKIAIITTASEIPEIVGMSYLKAFNELGCQTIDVLHFSKREEVDVPEALDKLNKVDGIWFTGGNQLKLTSVFGGSAFLERLHERYQHDKFIIAGTSAGAMAMSQTMIYQGTSHEALLKGEVKITTGLGFVNNVIIDSHFVKRGRFGRLAQAVTANPSCLGVGLGEDTGVLIEAGDRMEAVGSGLIIVFDGHEIKHTNIADIDEGSPVSIENMVIHVMAKGNHFHLKERQFYAEMKNSQEKIAE